jgi:anthranilate synthase component 1
LDAIDALKAALPAGTLSGAPKIRAMQIINELEPSSRGIYGGAIGYISWNGNIDTAIAIRTAVIKDSVIHVGAGAGIVADSIPENEWLECKQKAKVFLDAMEMIS